MSERPTKIRKHSAFSQALDDSQATSTAATGFAFCPAGTTSMSGATACTPCPDGTFYNLNPSGIPYCSTSPRPTSLPTLLPTLAPTAGALSFGVQLSFSGLTQDAISADSTGSIAAALEKWWDGSSAEQCTKSGRRGGVTRTLTSPRNALACAYLGDARPPCHRWCLSTYMYRPH